MVPSFYFRHLLCEGCDTELPPSLVFYRLVLIAIYGASLGLYIYYLIGDYSARLKDEIFHRQGVAIEPGHGRILYKILMAFFATSVAPLSLVFFEVFSSPTCPSINGWILPRHSKLDNACCSDIRQRAIEKKLQLTAKIRALQAMSAALDQLIAECVHGGQAVDDCRSWLP